jgi:signal transduction histidine kinase
VARIVELHGGTVQVDPRPGGGALFTLRLPEPDRRDRTGPAPSR